MWHHSLMSARCYESKLEVVNFMKQVAALGFVSVSVKCFACVYNVGERELVSHLMPYLMPYPYVYDSQVQK